MPSIVPMFRVRPSQSRFPRRATLVASSCEFQWERLDEKDQDCMRPRCCSVRGGDHRSRRGTATRPLLSRPANIQCLPAVQTVQCHRDSELLHLRPTGGELPRRLGPAPAWSGSTAADSDERRARGRQSSGVAVTSEDVDWRRHTRGPGSIRRYEPFLSQNNGRAATLTRC